MNGLKRQMDVTYRRELKNYRGRQRRRVESFNQNGKRFPKEGHDLTRGSHVRVEG